MRIPPPHEPRPDDPYWKRWIARHGTATWENLARLPTTTPNQALEILAGFAALAVGGQHAANVNLGRWGVLAMPQDWVIAQLPGALDAVLARGEPWEYERALELGSLIDDRIVHYVLGRAAAHDDPEIRRTADEWR